MQDHPKELQTVCFWCYANFRKWKLQIACYWILPRLCKVMGIFIWCITLRHKLEEVREHDLKALWKWVTTTIFVTVFNAALKIETYVMPSTDMHHWWNLYKNLSSFRLFLTYLGLFWLTHLGLFELIYIGLSSFEII